jgi:hypothetical protein
VSHVTLELSDESTSGGSREDEARRASYFRELDAWTEYWDIYHPETHGRYYFGDDGEEPGLLSWYLPRSGKPQAFRTWHHAALFDISADAFQTAVSEPKVAKAVLEVDRLIGRIFAEHFGNPCDHATRVDYLSAMHSFAADTFPPAVTRDALISHDDPRKATAGRHALDGDLMWFLWALHLEAADLVSEDDHARRTLMMAGIATGCPTNFVWRGHRRSRPEYSASLATVALLRARGLVWARDFVAATREVHALYRLREWGEA